MNSGSVHLIDDDLSIRRSLCALLTQEGYEVSEWDCAQAFLDTQPQEAPAVVVTDMRMPGMSGVELHKALLQRGRARAVVYISGETSVPQTIEAMKLGAHDFLVKPFRREVFLQAVATALEKDRQHLRSQDNAARLEDALRELSPREYQVYGLLLKGLNNAEIMDSLQISLPTAKQYKSEVMRKLGARSLAQLIDMSQAS